MTEKHNHKREELAEAKKRIKELEKELNRKDKALAELAALIALKKKLESILEVEFPRKNRQVAKQLMIHTPLEGDSQALNAA